MSRASEINYELMVKALVKPGADILASLTPEKADAWHMATGIAGEAGELLAAFVESALKYQDIDLVNVIEELGDLEFYLEGLRQRVGIDRGETTGVILVGSVPHFDYAGEEASVAQIAACDVLDTVKKFVVYNKALDREALVGQLTKLELHLEGVRRLLDIERQTTLEANIEKLYLGNAKNKARYAEGSFSDAQAQARADKQEALVTPRGSLGECK